MIQTLPSLLPFSHLLETSASEWCMEKEQTTVHLFWECPVVQPIWDKISKWLSSKLNCRLEIQKELVFLYDIEAGNFTVIINLIILIVTRHIYVCHFTEKQPSFISAKFKVDDLELLERCIATKNDMLYKHNKKCRKIME